MSRFVIGFVTRNGYRDGGTAPHAHKFRHKEPARSSHRIARNAIERATRSTVPPRISHTVSFNASPIHVESAWTRHSTPLCPLTRKRGLATTVWALWLTMGFITFVKFVAKRKASALVTPIRMKKSFTPSHNLSRRQLFLSFSEHDAHIIADDRVVKLIYGGCLVCQGEKLSYCCTCARLYSLQEDTPCRIFSRKRQLDAIHEYYCTQIVFTQRSRNVILSIT